MRIARASRSPYRPPRFLAVAMRVRHSSSVRYSRTRTVLLGRRRGGCLPGAGLAAVPATICKATFPFPVLGIISILLANLRRWAARGRASFPQFEHLRERARRCHRYQYRVAAGVKHLTYRDLVGENSFGTHQLVSANIAPRAQGARRSLQTSSQSLRTSRPRAQGDRVQGARSSGLKGSPALKGVRSNTFLSAAPDSPCAAGPSRRQDY